MPSSRKAPRSVWSTAPMMRRLKLSANWPTRISALFSYQTPHGLATSRFPQCIVEGYATLFDEIDRQIAAAGQENRYIVAVPAGVGSLLSAAIRHYRTPGRIGRTRVLCVEAETAACVLASVRAGEP